MASRMLVRAVARVALGHTVELCAWFVNWPAPCDILLVLQALLLKETLIMPLGG